MNEDLFLALRRVFVYIGTIHFDLFGCKFHSLIVNSSSVNVAIVKCVI